MTVADIVAGERTTLRQMYFKQFTIYRVYRGESPPVSSLAGTLETGSKPCAIVDSMDESLLKYGGKQVSLGNSEPGRKRGL